MNALVKHGEVFYDCPACLTQVAVHISVSRRSDVTLAGAPLLIPCLLGCGGAMRAVTA